MLGSPCSPCCAVPELLGWGGTNSRFFFSSVRTPRGAVFGFDVCGTKSTVTSQSGSGVDVIDCSEGNASECAFEFGNNNTGSLSMECVLRVPIGSAVTLTLSGEMPSTAYIFAGLRSVSESTVRSQSSSTQWDRQYNPDVLWDPMPYQFGGSELTDVVLWERAELGSWPCGSLNTVFPIYSLNANAPPRFNGDALQVMLNERRVTTFRGDVVCATDQSGFRSCSPKSIISRTTQHTTSDQFCLLQMFLRRNGGSSGKHAFAVTLSW
jgi:hypothetical protein